MVPTLPSLVLAPNPTTNWIEPNLRVVELTLEEPRRWNTILLQTLFSLEHAQEISKIPLSNYNFSSINDKIKWKHHYSRNFSVKLTYTALLSPTANQTSDIPWKKLWKLQIQDRLKFLLWKVSQNILPTRSLLRKIYNFKEDQILYTLSALLKKKPSPISSSTVVTQKLSRNIPNGPLTSQNSCNTQY